MILDTESILDTETWFWIHLDTFHLIYAHFVVCFGYTIFLDTFSYFWIRLDTFGYVWIRLDTFGYASGVEYLDMALGISMYFN